MTTAEESRAKRLRQLSTKAHVASLFEQYEQEVSLAGDSNLHESSRPNYHKEEIIFEENSNVGELQTGVPTQVTDYDKPTIDKWQASSLNHHDNAQNKKHNKMRRSPSLSAEEVEELEKEGIRGKKFLKFNVGGKVFLTHRDTVKGISQENEQDDVYKGVSVGRSDNLLAAMLNGSSDFDCEAGEILIDRDPKHFHTILSFLKADNPADFKIPDSIEKNSEALQELLQEAAFYQIAELKNIITKKIEEGPKIHKSQTPCLRNPHPLII